jgi:DNA sulfur modification protein DndC
MGPLTLEARRWGMEQIVAIQSDINAERGENPEVLLVNDEERAAILGMIEARVWPNGWSGDEERADRPFVELCKDGSVQQSLLEDDWQVEALR